MIFGLRIGYMNYKEFKGSWDKVVVHTEIIDAKHVIAAKSRATRILKSLDDMKPYVNDKYSSAIEWSNWKGPTEYKPTEFVTTKKSEPINRPVSIFYTDMTKNEEQQEKNKKEHPGTYAICQITWSEAQMSLFEKQ